MAEAILKAPNGSSIPSIEDSASSQQQQQLMRSHFRLMAVYADKIEKVYELKEMPRGAEPSKQRRMLIRFMGRRSVWRSLTTAFSERSYKHRPVTRALVEAHIKARLIELRTAYVQMEQEIPETAAEEEFLRWLRDTQGSLVRFSATVTFMVFIRRICSALWPLAIALAAVGTVWTTILHMAGGEKGRPVEIMTYVLVIIYYCLLGLVHAARTKRDFFLAPVLIQPSGWLSDSEDSSIGSIDFKSVYAAENALFERLGRVKRPEIPLDKYLYGVSQIVFAATLVLALSKIHGLVWQLGSYFCIPIFLVIGIMAIVSGYKRKLDTSGQF
jgi:hypothetical protein